MYSPVSVFIAWEISQNFLVPVIISALFPDGYAVKTSRGCQLHRVTGKRNGSKTPSSLNIRLTFPSSPPSLPPPMLRSKLQQLPHTCRWHCTVTINAISAFHPLSYYIIHPLFFHFNQMSLTKKYCGGTMVHMVIPWYFLIWVVDMFCSMTCYLFSI